TELARVARMSPYHFVRTFRAVIGMTPYQFVLRTRLHRAAVRLRRSNASISTIAFDAGFNDLSTFNRRFRRLMGASPRAYRGQDRRGVGRWRRSPPLHRMPAGGAGGLRERRPCRRRARPCRGLGRRQAAIPVACDEATAADAVGLRRGEP